MTASDLAAALFVLGFFLTCLVAAYCDIHALAKRMAAEDEAAARPRRGAQPKYVRSWLLAQVPGREDEAA